MAFSDRQALTAAAMADLPELTRRMMAAIRETVPAYRTLDADQQREVRDITVWGLSRVLRAWTQDDVLTTEDLARFQAIGAARAEDGRSITAVLRAYRVAAVAATDLLLDKHGGALDLADVRALTKVVLPATDQMSEAILAGHTAARDRLSSQRHLALADLFIDLLTGRHSSAAAFAERCRELGLDLPAPPLLVVAEPAERTLEPQHSELNEVVAALGLADLLVEHLARCAGRSAWPARSPTGQTTSTSSRAGTPAGRRRAACATSRVGSTLEALATLSLVDSG